MADQDSQYDVGELYKHTGCDDALHVLYEYLDGELTPARRGAIKRHLHDCQPCLHAFDFEAELRVVVARSCRDQVPEQLRAKVAAAISEALKSDGAGEPRSDRAEPSRPDSAEASKSEATESGDFQQGSSGTGKY